MYGYGYGGFGFDGCWIIIVVLSIFFVLFFCNETNNNFDCNCR